MSVDLEEAVEETIYECLECHKFFTRAYKNMIVLRDVPLEEVTARRLRGERISVFVCGECRDVLGARRK